MKLYVMTGDFITGKTTWLERAIGQAERGGISVAGVLCPAVFQGGKKTGIDAVLLPGRERFPYARPRSGGFVDERAHHAGVPAAGQMLGWDFSDEATARINENFASPACARCDLLVIDELGPLELVRGQGYTEALRLLDAGTPKAALTIVRPALLDVARGRWGSFEQLTPHSSIGNFLAGL